MEMATWVVHFRVAEYFLDKIDGLNKEEFIAGSVAPDCGYGGKDTGEFDPPPRVTHWSDTGMKKDCKYKDFYEAYLKGKEKQTAAYSFYLGYYVHLATDIMWSVTVYHATHRRFWGEFATDEEGFDKRMRKDWNDLDFKYLREHPDYEPYMILANKGEVADYLPYYEHNQLTVQSKFIVDYYKKEKTNEELYRDYKYLTQEIVDNFIACARELIAKDLENKDLV